MWRQVDGNREKSQTSTTIRLCLARGFQKFEALLDSTVLNRSRSIPIWLAVGGIVLALTIVVCAIWVAAYLPSRTAGTTNPQSHASTGSVSRSTEFGAYQQEKAEREALREVPNAIVSPNSEATALTADAIKALGRIEAAVQVGVNYEQYTQLVIDAKAVVNEAERRLPVSEMRTKLTQAIDAYRDAGRVWSHKIRYESVGRAIKREYGHGDIIVRYDMELDSESKVKSDKAMQIIWRFAAARLTDARILQ